LPGKNDSPGDAERFRKALKISPQRTITDKQ